MSGANSSDHFRPVAESKKGGAATQSADACAGNRDAPATASANVAAVSGNAGAFVPSSDASSGAGEVSLGDVAPQAPTNASGDKPAASPVPASSVTATNDPVSAVESRTALDGKTVGSAREASFPAESDNPNEGESARPRRRWVWVLCITAGILGLIVAPVGTWLLVVWSKGRAELRRAIAETDAEFPNWRWQDLLASREPLPSEEDAWPIIAELIRRHKANPQTRKIEHNDGFWNWWRLAFSNHPNCRAPDVHAQALSQWYASAAGSGLPELSAQLQQYRRARVPVPPLADAPVATLLPEHNELRSGINCLRWLQEYYLATGQHAQVEAVLLAQWKLVTSLDDDPFLIGQLIGVALEGLAIASIERSLAMGEISPKTRQLLASELQQRKKLNRFLWMIRSERALWHETFERVSTGRVSWAKFVREPAYAMGPSSSGSGSKDWWESVQTFFTERLPEKAEYGLTYVRRHWSHTHILRLCNELERAAQLPGDQLRPKVEDALNKFVRDWDQGPARLDISGVILPAWYRLVVTHLSRQARFDAALAGLAAEEFRLQHGRWPTDWSELVPQFLPQVPLDPWTGRPMQLRPTSEGMVIYSVGHNGADDGGHPDRDIVFRLYDPDKRNLPPPPDKPDKALP